MSINQTKFKIAAASLELMEKRYSGNFLKVG